MKTDQGQPICSVCIANYNGRATIGNAISSVLAQVGNIPVEIIVHDDASDDGSADWVQAKFPDVSLIRSVENVGFCRSNNRMAAMAQGEYLLLLNNDAALFQNALATLYTYALNGHQDALLGLPQFDAISGDIIDRGILLDLFLNTVPNFEQSKEDVALVIGACFWIRKALWNRLGGFPEWLHTLAEDMYLTGKARLLGYPAKVLHASGFHHCVGASLGGGKIVRNRLRTTLRRRALSERNRSYAMAVLYPAPVFHFIFPGHMVLLLVEGICISLLKRQFRLFTAIYLNAVTQVWQNRRQLLSQRSKVQAMRSVSARDFFAVFKLFPQKLKMLTKYGMPRIH